MAIKSLETESRLFTPVSPSSRVLAVPVIRREGIRWTGGAGGKPLSVELAFENPSPLESSPATAEVEVAPFGAFLRWTPLARITMPPLPPGGRRSLTATLAGDTSLPRPPELKPFSPATSLFALRRVAHAHHFVGNLNVYVNRSAPVERHIQRAVGLRPGVENLALFCVGDGRPDRYTFSVGSLEPGWDMEIVGVAWDAPIGIATTTIPLRVRPAPRAESGGVSVLVGRESTGQVVPVEFELDVAARSKCFFF
jgi:hypothetical protein